MKRLVAALVLAVPLSVMAADDPGNKIVIVNGKKFFPLQGARHFVTGSKPAPPPQAKQIPVRQTHPVVYPPSGGKAVRAVGQERAEQYPPSLSLKGKGDEHISHTPLPLAPPSENNTGSHAGTHSAASDVLSIFAPEEKGIQAPR
jgi:hypothetical protein